MRMIAFAVLVGCGGSTGSTASVKAPPPVAACPVQAPPPVDARTPPVEATKPETPEPPRLPPDVELSVSAEKNVERGRTALAAHKLEAARAYFHFAIERFPMSKFLHEAELGLADADADEFIAQGRDDVDTVNGYCQFIAHHPWHPRVANGDVACQVNKIQHTPCEAGDRVAARYCGRPFYCDDAEAAKRKECLAPKK